MLLNNGVSWSRSCSAVRAVLILTGGTLGPTYRIHNFIFLSFLFVAMNFFPTTKHPIHPIYQAVCDEHMKQLLAAQSEMNTTPEKQYQMITDLRLVADEFAKRVPLPETLRTKQEVFGGPKKMRVGTTVFRPLGSEEEILPVILYL